MALFEAMCAGAGIPTRIVVGLNLNTPDGEGDLHKIRPDYQNQHTWAEIYLPGSGWVEIDPGMGARPTHPAQLIQNNTDFQNYVIWIIEDGAVEGAGLGVPRRQVVFPVWRRKSPDLPPPRSGEICGSVAQPVRERG